MRRKEERTTEEFLFVIKTLDEADIPQEGRILWYEGYWYVDGVKMTEEEYQEYNEGLEKWF